jgi:hypothetical protein
MAIDYVVDYACTPKAELTTEGILERLKGRARAHEIIRLFREGGDQRPVGEIGFEMTRSHPDGSEETRVVMVQHLLDDAAELRPLEHHCAGCPANAGGEPFGCFGQINYPISAQAEQWLIDRLPSIEQPLVWLLLRQAVQEMGYTGDQARALRTNPAYFEDRRVRGRDLVEFVFSADQAFELLFLAGHVRPVHAAMLLLFFDAVPRDFEADVLVRVMHAHMDADEIAARFPLTLPASADDDHTTRELRQFFTALHRAWMLNVYTLLDV